MPGNDPKIRSDPASWTQETHERGDQAPARDDPPKVALAHISVTITTYVPQRSKAENGKPDEPGARERHPGLAGAIRLIVCIYTPENGG